jgi:hypothetical protein
VADMSLPSKLTSYFSGAPSDSVVKITAVARS